MSTCQLVNSFTRLLVNFSPLEHIAEARSADDVLGVGAEFLAQTGDVYFDGSFGDDDVLPDAVHELLAREDLSAVGEEQAEQAELGAGETGGLTVDAHALVVEVHLQAPKAEEAAPQACLYDIHDIVSQLLALGDDVIVDHAEGVEL